MVTPMTDRIVARLHRGLEAAEAGTAKTTLGFKAAGFGIERSWQSADGGVPSTLRDTVADALDANDHVTGVLVTIDEIHDAPAADVKAFANEFQHLLRNGYRVAFVGAGLPRGNLSDPVEVPTFLGRSTIPEMNPIRDFEIAATFTDSLVDTGFGFTPDGLERATDAAAGLPYAMQLIGWNLVDAAGSSDFDGRAVERVMPAVHSSLITGLRLPMSVSPGRLSYLDAMAHDDGPSRVSDVCRRLNRTAQQLSPVRAWLIDSGYITADEHGEVAFAHQGTRALLRTHPDAKVRDALRSSRYHGTPPLFEFDTAVAELPSVEPDPLEAILDGWSQIDGAGRATTQVEGPDLSM